MQHTRLMPVHLDTTMLLGLCTTERGMLCRTWARLQGAVLSGKAWLPACCKRKQQATNTLQLNAEQTEHGTSCETGGFESHQFDRDQLVSHVFRHMRAKRIKKIRSLHGRSRRPCALCTPDDRCRESMQVRTAAKGLNSKWGPEPAAPARKRMGAACAACERGARDARRLPESPARPCARWQTPAATAMHARGHVRRPRLRACGRDARRLPARPARPRAPWPTPAATAKRARARAPPAPPRLRACGRDARAARRRMHSRRAAAIDHPTSLHLR